LLSYNNFGGKDFNQYRACFFCSADKKNIEKLGFNFRDIKILLITHAHYDHVGAMADIKKMTGAQLMVDAADTPVLADGNMHLVMLQHPGHTKGACSYLFEVNDNKRS